MKPAGVKGNISKRKPVQEREHHSSPQQAAGFERERSILLALSNDITKVRGKDDLVKVFSSRLKQYFYFTHTVISLIDYDTGTYFPFLIDKESMQIRHRAELPALLQMKYVIDDPFLAQVKDADVSAIFLLDDIMHLPGIPAFIKVNYECGIRKAMIVKLKNKMKTIGYVLMYSDKADSFPEEFKNVLEGVAPHLSNAVTNIIINEEIEEREREKTILLSLSEDIAALRKREDLLQVVNTHIKNLFSVKEFGIAHVNEDGTTYSAFVIDVRDSVKQLAGFDEVAADRYDVNDPLFTAIMKSDEPLLIDVDELLKKPGMPAYARMWKTAGLKKVLAARLQAGHKNTGCVFLHLDSANPVPVKFRLVKAVCAHLSVAVSNILSNERIEKNHREQTFLLEFSNDIARVRTKAELQAAIFKVLEKTLNIRLGMIHVIEEDGINLQPFMYDNKLYVESSSKSFFDELVAKQVTTNEYYTSRVLASEDGVVFNVDQEAASGNPYARLWKATGYENMYALPLRTGNKNIGAIWLHANRLSALMVKGICAQISIAIANIQANEKLLAYKKQLEVENDYLREQIKTIYNFSDIIGSGEAMQKVYHLMSLVAESNSTVLLLGETGTGKELIARALHNASPRNKNLMVKVNCAALPPNLIESELFGHEKGAFTGAIERRIGKFELANNSTLFLDEIGEMPLETQVKLLRVLQERELERVGGKTTIKVDVRIIAATNRNLEDEVRAGRFRSDLYYRLNVFPITLPPLRNRIEDIEALANFFIARYSKNSGRNITSISPKCLQQLRSYSWPGNVRELEHLIERSILLTQGNVLEEVQLPVTFNDDISKSEDTGGKTLEELERNYIIEVLKRCSGKISGKGGAAEHLGIPSTTLHSKMKKLQIAKADYFQ
jgi:formate hydrogenlyase transcriptional activator